MAKTSKSEKAVKPNVFMRIGLFIKQIIDELRKVVTPTAKELFFWSLQMFPSSRLNYLPDLVQLLLVMQVSLENQILILRDVLTYSVLLHLQVLVENLESHGSGGLI